MLAYVDESGCTGMKLGKGSSELFVVTAVLFEDRTVASECHEHIQRLRKKLQIPTEFKFNKCSHDTRLRFLEEIARFDFAYAGIVFDKRRLECPGVSISKPFLRDPVFSLFARLAPRMVDATITIDRTGSSDFRKTLAKELKDEINRRFARSVIKKVKDEQSHKHNLLQLADMVCGAVNRSHCQQRKNADDYRKIIMNRELGIDLCP